VADPTSRRPLLALLGGTFDPVHYGHLHLADDVQRALHPAEVRLIPGGDPPHRDAPRASATHRLAMLELARTEFPALTIDRREIDRGGKSYTVRTLESLRSDEPSRPLAWIVGADALAGIPTWHRWRDLFELAHIIVVARPGFELDVSDPPLADEWRERLTNSPADLTAARAGSIYVQAVTPYPISASAIRAELARGPAGEAAVRGLLPESVLAYIGRNRLYQP